MVIEMKHPIKIIMAQYMPYRSQNLINSLSFEHT